MQGRKSVLLILTLIGLLFLQATSIEWMRMHQTPFVGLKIEKSQKWDPQLFKTFFFGYWPVAVTGLWMRVLQDSALSHVPREQRAPIFYDLDLMTDLDPAFFEAYVEGGLLLAIVRDDVYGARELLLKGEQFRKTRLSSHPASFFHRYWQQSWAVPFHLAYIEMFELDNIPAASVHFEVASRIAGAPPYLQSLSQKLKTTQGQYDVGLRLIKFMIEGAKDPKVKEELVKKHKNLYLGQYLFNLNTLLKSKIKSKKARQDEVRGMRDPFGGQLFIDPSGRIETTTSRKKVFGFKD